MNLENQTALITGSSGGIGEDFAVAFAKRKANLILVALGGGLGLCLEIASVRMVVDIAEDLRDRT